MPYNQTKAERGICLLDSALQFAALTRAQAGFGELRPQRFTLKITG